MLTEIFLDRPRPLVTCLFEVREKFSFFWFNVIAGRKILFVMSLLLVFT